jgi:hypothetical protein
MPALDRYHNVVREALIKDGWNITDDPLTLRLDGRNYLIDLGAERFVLGAEKGNLKIAVEVKNFISPSPIAELEKSIGQFGLYEDVLERVEADRTLYLAIPEAAYETIFAEEIGQITLQKRISRLIVFSLELEEIIKWLPQRP